MDSFRFDLHLTIGVPLFCQHFWSWLVCCYGFGLGQCRGRDSYVMKLMAIVCHMSVAFCLFGYHAHVSVSGIWNWLKQSTIHLLLSIWLVCVFFIKDCLLFWGNIRFILFCFNVNRWHFSLIFNLRQKLLWFHFEAQIKLCVLCLNSLWLTDS